MQQHLQIVVALFTRAGCEIAASGPDVVVPGAVKYSSRNATTRTAPTRPCDPLVDGARRILDRVPRVLRQRVRTYYSRKSIPCSCQAVAVEDFWSTVQNRCHCLLLPLTTPISVAVATAMTASPDGGVSGDGATNSIGASFSEIQSPSVSLTRTARNIRSTYRSLQSRSSSAEEGARQCSPPSVASQHYKHYYKTIAAGCYPWRSESCQTNSIYLGALSREIDLDGTQVAVF